MLALEGVKILDLSRQAPGPLCTMILSDLGAEVIRIEAPPGASSPRSMTAQAPTAAQRRRIVHQFINRNKKSIGLNLQSEEAHQIFYKMAENADVVIEAFKP